MSLNVDQVAAAQAERKLSLIDLLTTPPTGGETVSARKRLQHLLGPDTLDQLDQHLIDLLTETDPDPDQPGFFTAVQAAQTE